MPFVIFRKVGLYGDAHGAEREEQENWSDSELNSLNSHTATFTYGRFGDESARRRKDLLIGSSAAKP